MVKHGSADDADLISRPEHLWLPWCNDLHFIGSIDEWLDDRGRDGGWIGGGALEELIDPFGIADLVPWVYERIEAEEGVAWEEGPKDDGGWLAWAIFSGFDLWEEGSEPEAMKIGFCGMFQIG